MTHKRLLLISFLLLLVISITVPVYAQNELALTKAIVGNPTTVQTGELITYRLQFACNSLTAPCGALNITDILPGNVTHVETQVTTAQGYSATFDGGTNTVTISHPNFLDGSSSEALIIVRVDSDAPDNDPLSNSATGTITDPAQSVTTPPVTVTVDPPTEQWSVQKTKVAPIIDASLDNNVTYDVELCADSPTGNVSLTNATLFDDLPPNVTIIDDGGGTVGASPLGGGRQRITWNLGTLDIDSYQPPNNCETRTIVIRYPSTDYNQGDTVSNDASAEADFRNSPGIVVVGTDDATHGIIAPQPTPLTDKAVQGSPVGLTGLGRFLFTLNTDTSNVPITNVVMTDTMPPELQVTEIESGLWTPAFVQAVVSFSTDGVTFTPLGTVDGDDNTLFAAPVTNISHVRWTFSYTDPFDGTPRTGVPLGFRTAAGEDRPEIRFNPRTTGSPQATPGSVYQNCIETTYKRC